MAIVPPTAVSDPAVPIRALTPAIPLIDRKREVAELRTALEAVLGGQGRVVLLGGEPGIGKTRLASFLADEATSRGVPVWWGRGWEDGSAPAFWPWNTALRRWLDRVGYEEVAAAAGSWAAELAHVFPVLRDRIPELPPSERWESDGARFRLFDLVSRFLGVVACPAGLVVVLDDIHWADPASLKLLEFVAAELTDKRILVIATYRDTEVRRDDALFSTLSRLVREPSTRRLLVGGLPLPDCAQWVALSGVPGDPTALAEMLHRETNGNPFFVGEIVHLLAAGEGGRTDATVHRVPQGVQEVIGRRLDRLGTDCRATLGVAALFADAIDTGLLAEILADAALEDHLEIAVRDRILVEDEDRPRHYRFAHGLIRRVLVDELQPSARAAWHARIATVLERYATTGEVVTTELVRHLAEAGTAESLRKAFAYACRGAEQAASDLGWEEAVRLYDVALDVGRRSGLLDSGSGLELRLAMARALRGSGDVPAARGRCEEVMAACRRTPNPEAFARAALIYAGSMPEWGRVEPAVRAVLEEACQPGPTIDDALKARLYARLAGDLVAANEVEQGERVFTLCDEAAAAARRASDHGALAIALMGIHVAATTGMRWAANNGRVPSSEEILEAAEAGGEHEYAAAIRYTRAMTFLAIGEPEAFSAEVDAIATAAAATRVPEALWLAEALPALRQTIQGRFAEARESIERALEVGRRMQLPNAIGVHMSQSIMWHLLQGRIADIAPEIEHFVDEHPGGPGWRPVRALARLAAGNAVAARAEFERLLAAGLAPAERGVMARSYLVGLAALCVELRDREHAPLLYDCIARRAEEWSVGGCQTLGPWALLLGALARLCERPAEAIQHFETAIRLGRRMGSPAIVARAQSLLASLLLSTHPGAEQRERSAVLLAEAGQGAQEIGLADVAARVARLQCKLGDGHADDCAFWRDGDVWAVRYAGRELRLKDGKGPRYLAVLLSAPGREVHVLQFGTPAAPSTAVVPEGLSIGQLGGALDDAPDMRARNEYRARLGDLRAELEEAEQFADNGRAERVREEIELLLSQLEQRFTSHGRVRSPAETARKAVTKVLRTQIGRLLEIHPALGRHLRETVRMGKVCVYAPPTPVEWSVGFGQA